MDRRKFLLSCLVGGGALGTAKWLGVDAVLKAYLRAESPEPFGRKGYYRIVALADPHLPVRQLEYPTIDKRQRIIKAKDGVVDDINSWADVDEIAVVGDICAQFGEEAELRYAKEYFSRLAKPVFVVAGNHDYIYQDDSLSQGKFVFGDTTSRQSKLRHFKEIFGLDSYFYSRQAGPYQLIYLSIDSMERYLAVISQEQLAWFDQELAKNPECPTIVFFHAPLNGTLDDYDNEANTPDFVAQPVAALDKLIKKNPQLILWVSGHTHTPATNESYASYINIYKDGVRNIHTPDMDSEIIWSNSLYLYPHKIVIRTFNHSTKEWEAELERVMPLRSK